jgi:hypothetical protein
MAMTEIDGVVVCMSPDGTQSGEQRGQGRTGEHADLLDKLAAWAEVLPALGIDTLQVTESQPSALSRDRHLTVIVTAPLEHMDTALNHLAVHRRGASATEALHGVGITPTGHQLLINLS